MNAKAARATMYLLVGIAAALALLVFAQYAGMGRGYDWLTDSPSGDEVKFNIAELKRSTFNLPPAATFAEVENRPLFNGDRKPTPADAVAPSAEEAPPPAPLNATLTGVIITADARIALLHDNAKNQAVSLKVGMPLEGDQANWTLAEIKPRSVVFKNADNESNELELQTSAPAAAPAPTAPVPNKLGKGVNSLKNPAKPAAKPSSNEDLARRIEERRRRMREETERVHGGTDPNQAPIDQVPIDQDPGQFPDQVPEEEGLLEPQN